MYYAIKVKCFLYFSDEDIIEVYDQQFVHMYDPPHLIKGIRNNLLTKLLKYIDRICGKTKYARWEVIQKLYDMNPETSKLTAAHMVNIKKMRVKYAAQVLSRSVAHGIRFACRLPCKFVIYVLQIINSFRVSRLEI